MRGKSALLLAQTGLRSTLSMYFGPKPALLRIVAGFILAGRGFLLLLFFLADRSCLGGRRALLCQHFEAGRLEAPVFLVGSGVLRVRGGHPLSGKLHLLPSS